jgi:2-C-methyl-D-erythritol 4-phosphate cytidylyltransferase
LTIDNRQLAGSSEVAVLVPAAGRGTRLGGWRKQFRLLHGKPLLVQTLRAFERHPLVHHLVVAAPPGQLAGLAEALRAEGMTKLTAVVPGGATRQDSVGEALRAAPEAAGIILVHDAVRPFVGSTLVRAVVEAVRLHGAAAPAVPVTDTIRQGEGGVFGATVPRDSLFRMQTPQGFRRDWFEAAHARARADGFQATDDVDLVRHLGHAVRIVAGSDDNLKVTTPDDWSRAARLWPAWVERRDD